MGFKAKTTSRGGDGESYPIAPAGSIPAVLVGLIDLGTQWIEYQGEGEHAPKLYLVWELPDEKVEGYKDRNHVIGRDYRFSMHVKSGLRKDIERWRGKPYGDDEEVDLLKLLGKPCLLSIEHKTSGSGNEYARITGVAQLPKGTKVGSPQHKPFAWSMDDGEVVLEGDKLKPTGKKDPPAHDWLPYLYGDPVKDVIADSQEMKGGGKKAGKSKSEEEGEPVGAGAESGDVPF